MRTVPTPAAALVLLTPLLLASGSCGGGDGGTDPITVTSVVITAPAAPPSLQTLGRTVQFAASARDASNAPVAGATITWQSTNAAAATVSGTGLVSAVANGSTTITAHAGGVASAGVIVTVAQAVDTILPTPTTVAFGAIGSTRQLAIAVIDSSDALVAGAAAPTWTRVGSGTVASVSATGLVTALAVGNSDTAVATLGTKVARVPISVTQVVAQVHVTPVGTDTLETTGRTKQYAAVARDSMANAIGGAGITWSTGSGAVATVDGDGLATAVGDGTTQVTATSSGISGSRTLVVRRYAETFTMTPNSAASITVNAGTLIFTGTALDSVNTSLPIDWLSRNEAILTVAPATGAQTTATADANGQAYVVMLAGQRRDSALVTVSGQEVLPTTAAVTVLGFAFESDRNNSTNPAIDTVGVGGTVTWTWNSGGITHNVTSQGSPSFSSSGNQNSGTFFRTFNTIGSYEYLCLIHPSMTGRVVVR